MFETWTRYRIKKLTIWYGGALSVIALMNVGAWGVLQTLIRSQAHDATVVNLAGRQRMLSQRIAKGVLLLAGPPLAHDISETRTELRMDAEVFSRTQQGLRHGDVALGLPAVRSPAVLSRLDVAEVSQERIVELTRSALETEGPPSADLVGRISDETARFLPVMDDAVSQIEAESAGRSSRLAAADTAMLGVVLLVVFAEALLIFRPMIQRAWSSYSDLRTMHEGLTREMEERRRAERERDRLQGLLPICASCKQIRDADGAWHALELFIERRSSATFSHGLCPACAERLYPEYVSAKKG